MKLFKGDPNFIRPLGKIRAVDVVVRGFFDNVIDRLERDDFEFDLTR